VLRHEIRFGPDVRDTARAVMRKAKHVALVGRRHDQIDVIEAAIEHSAI
jgi:NADP-dependent 3-hydroxy acid dehydrogenase YdfG